MNRSDAAKLPHMKRRILATFANATAADLADGIAWYDRAYRAAQGILPSDPDRAAGVIAALSPRCQWKTNVAWAAALIEAAESAATEPPPVHTTAMRKVAWKIAQGVDPLDALNGPKTRRFYLNIVGDLTAVTVDVWAARIAEGDWRPHPTKGGEWAASDKPAPSGRRYDLIERAYREAADMLGMAPRDVQAATWVA